MDSPYFFKWMAYQKSELLSQSIFNLTLQFPSEEKFSLTDQIRRSSRSVSANLAESYAKRRYEKHFVSKLTDAHGENYETMTWLRNARRCRYINDEEFTSHFNKATEIEKLIGYMLSHQDRFRGSFGKKV